VTDGVVLGVVLAGGLSRRMGGGDKTLRLLAGRSLLDRVVERFAPQCGAGLILNANGDPARFTRFPGEIIADDVPDHSGPLAGILAALDYAAHTPSGIAHVASVTGDAPFLPLDLVARLAGAARDAPIAMASSNGREHFTVALWPVAVRAALRDYLVVRGERRVGGFLREQGAVAVEWGTDPLDPFWNINTPDDLGRAESYLANA